jgi:hypothetical protein
MVGTNTKNLVTRTIVQDDKVIIQKEDYAKACQS